MHSMYALVIMLLMSTTMYSQIEWKQLQGPSGGTYSSICYSRLNPRIIVVTPFFKGLPMYTVDDGVTWNEMHSFPVTTLINGSYPPIQHYPFTYSTFWFQDGFKIIATTDYGDTWTTWRDLPSTGWLGYIEMHPTDDNLILMRSRYLEGETKLLVGIYSNSWITMESPPFGPIIGVRRILFSPKATSSYIAQTNDGYVHSCRTSRGYFERQGKVTLDGTITGTVLAIDVLNSQRLYGEVRGVICVSTDLGNTWKAKMSDVRGQIRGFTQESTDPNIIYAYGSVLWRSVDRGESWSLADSLLPLQIDAYSNNGNLTMNCLYHGLVRISSVGKLVPHLDASIRNRPINRLWRISEQRMIAKTATGMSSTSDGGLTWIDFNGQDMPSANSFETGDVDLRDPDHIVNSYYYDYPCLTTNGGSTWSYSTFNGDYSFMLHLSIDPIDGSNVIGTSYNYISKSNDGGFSFTVDSAVVLLGPRMITRSPADPSVILICEDRALTLSTDNGFSWRQFTNRLDKPIDVIGHPKNSSYFCYASQKGLFTTTNMGEKWTQHPRLTFPITDICFDSKDDDILYAAGFKGRLFRMRFSTGQVDTIVNAPAKDKDTLSIRSISESKGFVYATTLTGYYSALIDPTSSLSDSPESPFDEPLEIRYYSILGEEINTSLTNPSQGLYFKVFRKRGTHVRTEKIQLVK